MGTLDDRLAQLARAPPRHGGGHWSESSSDHYEKQKRMVGEEIAKEGGDAR